MTERLRLRHRGSHRLRALLEFDADAFAVNGVLMPVPGKALDTDLGDIAAKATIAVDQCRPGTRTRRSQGGGKPPGAAANDQNVRFQNNVDRPSRLFYLFHTR